MANWKGSYRSADTAERVSAQTTAGLVRGDGGTRLLSIGSWKDGPAFEDNFASFAFSPDGSLLALHDGHAIRLFDPVTGGRELARLEDPNQDGAASMHFTPDGTRFVAITNNDLRAIRIWDLQLDSRWIDGTRARLARSTL